MTDRTPLNLAQIRANVTELASTHPQIVADVSALIAHVRHLEAVNRRLRAEAATGELWRLAAEAVSHEEPWEAQMRLLPAIEPGGVPGLADDEARAYLAAMAGEEDAEVAR